MTETFDNPGQKVYVRLAKIVNDGRHIYLPESCVNAMDVKRGIEFRDGQTIRLRWPDRTLSRQVVAFESITEDVEDASGKVSLVTSRLYGVWRGLGSDFTVRGHKPAKAMVWVELDGLELEMAAVELAAFERQFAVQDPGAPVVAPVASQADADSAAVLELLQRMSGRLDALEDK